MNIARSLKNEISAIPEGKIFRYQDLLNYANSSGAVVKTINRLVANKTINRISKGKFYVAKYGILGIKKPSDKELLRVEMYKNNRIQGYVTGKALYNQLGLTTQVPRTITIACNGGRQEKEYKTIRIKKIVTRIPIEEKNVKLMQYLDVLKDLKKIPDSDINLSLKRMCRFISELTDREKKDLISLAIRYYTPQVRALTSMLLDTLNIPVPSNLNLSLNPVTTYKLRLDTNIWPLAKKWNIK